MKKIIFILLVTAQFILTAAQYPTHIDLVVQEVAETDFAPFLFSNDLSGAPRIFAVQMSPEEGNVRIRGILSWKKDENSGFEQLLTFRTKAFAAQSFFNNELGTSAIPVGRTTSNSDLIDLNRERGKPTGQYKLEIILLDENGTALGPTDTEYYSFDNPAQTLTIRIPEPGSIQNIGGVLAEWDFLEGIEYYEVLANVRENKQESLEEALESGEPVINDVNVGAVTSIDLRSILTREWLPGQEIVVQVSAIPIGANPTQIIESNIVNFYLDDPSNPAGEAAGNELASLLQSLSDNLGDELLEKLLNGDIQIDAIIYEETGLPLSPEEIQDLLNYLRQNPDNLINVEQD